MLRLRIFLLLVATIILPCKSIPDDVDDFNRISASLSLQNSEFKIKNEKHSRDFEMKYLPATIPPYLAQFLQQGNNLFFKPQILLGSTLNNSPYISHESEIKEEKEKQEKEIGVSVNSIPLENDKIIKENDEIAKDNDKIVKDDDKMTKEIDNVLETIEEKLPEIPEAPILAPLEMPVLPQIIVDEPEEIIVEEPENVIVQEPEHVLIGEPDHVIIGEPQHVILDEPEDAIVGEREHVIGNKEEPEHVKIEETAKPEEELIEKKHNIVIPEAPALMPLNPPKYPLQILVPKPVTHVPTCTPIIDNGYAISIPCFPNYAQPQYSPSIINFQNVIKNKDLVRSSFPLPKIPLDVTFNRPAKTVMPFREDLISTTRYLPSTTVSKFPLRTNLRLLKNPHRRLSQMIMEKVPLTQEKAEVFEEPLSSFSAYCAHNIALQRILPNIAEDMKTINAVPLLELPERPVY